MTKQISNQTEWNSVAEELEQETLKLASYDDTLLGLIGNVKGRLILDYGCGPGVLASALSRGEAKVKTYDISEEMRTICGDRIGTDGVYETTAEIPVESFDIVICNLVMCVVDEDEVSRISENIRSALNKQGRAYVGFCNPLIFDIPESQLDLRPTPTKRYDVNHQYMKTKKEGEYRIVEEHRPIEWYERVFTKAGLLVVGKHFTPKYELNGQEIQDFVIFELKRR